VRFTYYGYNAFVIEGGGKTIIVDPGQNLHWRHLDSLVPFHIWPQVDLILVTHGDADHAEYAPQVALTSRAPVVCGPALVKKWRRKGLNVMPLPPGEKVMAAGVTVEGVGVRHGPTLTLLGRTCSFPFVGKGAVGLLFSLDDRKLLNLGDTVLLEGVWGGLCPDVLMVPIGGLMTMDVDAALQAVAAIEPEIVIPMHYDWDILFFHRSVDVERFAAQVQADGRRCFPLLPGASVKV
jgi:L-ascorbate metabolism protein UlaG (beta-lactamase superfamily)